MQYGVTSGESHFLETSYVSFIYVDIMESQKCSKKGKGDGLPQFTGGIEEAKSQFFTVWHFDVILGLDPLPSARPLETGMISSQSFGFAHVLFFLLPAASLRSIFMCQNNLENNFSISCRHRRMLCLLGKAKDSI